MQQKNTYVHAAGAVIALLAFLPLAGCGGGTSCRELTGQWSNREGQTFVFQPNGKGLWLIRFGSEIDTTRMEYRYDCQKQPAELDLSGFETGPLSGKTLFGILEWNSDTSFRFDAEAGPGPEVRPVTFESDQTQKFYLQK